jgi:type I restriction enzyme S subunit
MTDSLQPQQWLTVPLEDVILRIVGGGTPSKSQPEYYQGEIPWMSVKDMNKHVLEDTVDHISQTAVDNSSTNVIPAGTPIIATRMSLGKIVVANFESAINQDLKALFLPATIHRDYLVYWYRSVARTIEQMGTGTTVKGIRLEALKGLAFALPPLAEQKVIADKLGTLLAQVENTKARLECIPQILKRFRQSVLAAAVSGRLTEEWRELCEVEVCFNDIQTQKEFLIQSKQIKKDLVAESKVAPFSIPTNWLFLALQSVATKITDGEHKTPKRENSGRYLLSARNIRDGYISIENVDFIGEEEFNRIRKRCDPNSGDILISCSGSVGRVSLVDQDNTYAMVRSAAQVRVLKNFIDSKFLMRALQSPMIQKNIEESSKSTAQSNLFLGPIKQLGIPLPPLAEQTEIVHRVDQLFAHADRIEQQVNNALARVNNLTQSILAKAFRGELTEQWRKGNPELISGENSAEALLERIKVEREAMKPANKTRKRTPA